LATFFIDRVNVFEGGCRMIFGYFMGFVLDV